MDSNQPQSLSEMEGKTCAWWAKKAQEENKITPQELEIKKGELLQHISQINSPESILSLKEKFKMIPEKSFEQILYEVKEKDIVKFIDFYLLNTSATKSVYLEYTLQQQMELSQVIKKVSVIKNQQQNPDQKEKLEKNGNTSLKSNLSEKELKDLTDEELISYEEKLENYKNELKKQQFQLNSKSNLIKKIQEFNQMKEICNTVFEKFASINKMTLVEVCDQFGISEKDRKI